MTMPGGENMPLPSQDVRNISDDRIQAAGFASPRRYHNSTVEYQSTADGDVVIVQPSFDDSASSLDHQQNHLQHAKTPPESPTASSHSKSPWQGRGPSEEGAEARGKESRNPASPLKIIDERRRRNHHRNLSAHFFDATSLKEDEEATEATYGRSGLEDEKMGRKHRRIFSNDQSNPPLAHRRINSVGNSKPVRRNTSQQGSTDGAHHRVDSAGLDILSAAADVTKDVLAEAAGAPSNCENWTGHPHPHDSSRPYVHPGAPQHHPVPTHPHMNPPPPQHRHHTASGTFSRPVSSAPYPSYPPSQFHPYMPPPPPPGPIYPSNVPRSHHVPPPHGYYTHRPPPPPAHEMYPSKPASFSAPRDPIVGSSVASHPEFPPSIQEEDDAGKRVSKSPPPAVAEQWAQMVPGNPNGAHQGVQTFVTALSVGTGTKTINPTLQQKNASTNTDCLDTMGKQSVPSHVGHHRKMSSFSSLGTFLGSSFLSPSGTDAAGKQARGHHRSTSSSVSFLGFDVGLEATDDAFLRNLHASNSTMLPSSSGQSESSKPDSSSPTAFGDGSDGDGGPTTASKLASGGTSKRVRRKCTVQGCQNRVVQGGLCISHGAKRKTCKHPGCTKNVKKAGLCSTHGPARKRCSAEGCEKVAVQGGKCIAHGAKKKLCSVDGCTKQAILSGMCKKHHDQSGGKDSTHSAERRNSSDSQESVEDFCQEVSGSQSAPSGGTGSRKPTHARGLSIFQEISADAVKSLLNEDDGPSMEQLDERPDTSRRGGNLW